MRRPSLQPRYVVPDGGWGWIVAIAAFLSNMLNSGVTYTFSALLPYLIETFEKNRFTLSWIAGVQMACVVFIGPVVSLVGSKIGFRSTCFIGSIASAVGLFSSFFATHFAVLYVTMGVIVGCGQGLMYLSTMAMVSMYFDKKRSFATGIATAGSGIGTFIFGQLVPIFITKYSWQGSCMVMSGIMLHGCVLATVLQPLPLNKQQDNAAPEALPVLEPKASVIPESGPTRKASKESPPKSDNTRLTCSASELASNSKRSSHTIVISSLVDLSEVMYFQNPLSDKRGSQCLRAPLEEIVQPEVISTSKKDGAKVSNMMKVLCNYHLFCDPLVSLFLGTMALSMFAYYPPFTFIIDKTHHMNYPISTAKHFLSVIGAVNTVSRLVFGFIGSLPGVDRNIMLVISLLGLGVSHILLPWCVSTWSLFLYCVGFGMSVGVLAILQSVVLCDLVNSVEVLPSAMAMFMILTGVPILVSNSIAGAIYDGTKDHNNIYIYCGVIMLAAGFLCIPLPYFVRRRNALRRQQEMETENISNMLVDISDKDNKHNLNSDTSQHANEDSV